MSPRRPLSALSAVLLAALAAAPACATDEGGKPDEEEAPQDGKLDSFASPIDHGALPFDTAAPSELTATARFHAWTFELSGTATLDITTSYAVRGQRRTDTVLYLYKEGPTGWGPYIARNDDAPGTVYSRLTRELGAGRYRVLVKGYQASTVGKFSVRAGCEGAGCAAAEPEACLFGATYHELFESGWVQVVHEADITAANLDTLSARDQAKLVRAVQQSSHTDVTTPAEALGRVDQGEVNVTWVADPDARRMFLAFEYGAGDNSYGAIFDRDSDAMAAAIHDGDLDECTARREVCRLPADWAALRTDPAFPRTSQRTIAAASELTGVAAAQVLATFQSVYDGDPVASLADGLGRVDGGTIDLITLRHAPTDTAFDVVAFYAGDTSVGAVFFAGTTTRAAKINDLAIEACAFFE